jgi:hypothetical protein
MNDTAPLGIIQLANKPLTFPGCLGNPNSFPYPVIYDTAEDAYVSNIFADKPSLANNYCAAALRLKARGARAILATCGFAVVYQPAIAERVQLPTVTSSLLLLPSMLQMLAPGKKVTVLTFDKQQLNERFLRAAGATITDGRIEILGIEKTASWHELNKAVPEVIPVQLRSDLLSVVATASPSTQAFLLECSAFCMFADDLRQLTGKPVSDFHTAADGLMQSIRGRQTTVSR